MRTICINMNDFFLNGIRLLAEIYVNSHRSTSLWRSACCSSSMPMSRGEFTATAVYIYTIYLLLFTFIAFWPVTTSKTFYFASMIVPCFCPRIPVSSLVDSWPSLLALLKDSVPLGLPAPGQFLILGLVSLPSLLLTVVQVSLYPHNIWGITTVILTFISSGC